MAEVESRGEGGLFNRKNLVSLLLLLLAINITLVAVLLVKNCNNRTELVTTLELKEKLQKEIRDYESKVAMYEGQLGERDTLLAQSKREIDSMRMKIEELIKEKMISRDKYEKALEDLEILKYYTKKYQTQIEELTRENRLLTSENEGLKKNVNEANRTIDKLLDTNVLLTNKLSLGAMLKANTLEVRGISGQSVGKERLTNKGSLMDGLKITFSLKENNLAQKGNRTFYIKIINPKGETIFIEERGGGKFKYQDSESLYTIKEIFNFDNNPNTVFTIYWAKGSPFEKGVYNAQLFTDGSLIGENNFEVK